MIGIPQLVVVNRHPPRRLYFPHQVRIKGHMFVFVYAIGIVATAVVSSSNSTIRHPD